MSSTLNTSAPSLLAMCRLKGSSVHFVDVSRPTTPLKGIKIANKNGHCVDNVLCSTFLVDFASTAIEQTAKTSTPKKTH